MMMMMMMMMGEGVGDNTYIFCTCFFLLLLAPPLGNQGKRKGKEIKKRRVKKTLSIWN
jgi:hypothetical protein